MKHDKYDDPPMRLVDHVFDIGSLTMEGEPDDFTWVYVLDLHGDDRAKAARINKRFFGGTAAITDWPAFNMVRLLGGDEAVVRALREIVPNQESHNRLSASLS